MVRLEGSVELPPVHLRHDLVVEAEMVQQDRARRRRDCLVPQCQLHLGEEMARPALRHQEGPAFGAGHAGEVGRVHEPDARGERVDAERGPGQIEEGEGGHDRDLGARVGAQELDGALGHEWRPRDGIDDRLR